MTEKLKYFLFVIVLLSTASNIIAKDSKPSLKIFNSEKKMVTLVGDNTKNTSLTLSIFDQKGTFLLKDKIVVVGQYSKAYDFSELPVGTYEVEVENSTSIRNYIVTTSSTNLSMVENKQKEIYKPVVESEGAIVSINMLNLSLETVAVRINDKSGEEVYMEKFDHTSTIHKSYDLSKLPSGKYSFLINTQGKLFNIDVNLN